MKQMNKWFIATIATSVALVVAIIVAIVLGVSGGAATPEIPEGPETGRYYYDAESGEYSLHLHSGNQFLLNDGVNKVGKYTVSGDTLTFDFTKDSNGEASAKLEGNVLTFTYNNQEIRFLKEVNFTVTFDANGGESATKSATVINGKSVAKPSDPSKAGSLFIGWYADKDLTVPYSFDTAVVTADTTIYAKWVAKTVGQVEYTVDFEGADVEDMTTIGGKLYNVPTPEKSGYTFGGWWISDFEDADKLTRVYTEDTVFNANTTLFAVWTVAEGDKLAAPLVSVSDNGLSWANANASTYAVKITAPNGNVVLSENVSATTMNFDFDIPGEYVIEVTSVANNTANNSETTTRYYNAKALDRVSLFTIVEPSTLIFNSVGADKYYITVKCGNENHKHDMIDNGKSTVFSFVNCDMKEGGIEFVVTAVKNGYAKSVSETFVCERKLDKVADITVDESTETVVWTPVANAIYYSVSVTVGDKTLPTVYTSDAFYSFKFAPAGEVTVKVVPVTKGYLSPEAASVTYTKTSLSAPAGLKVNGTVVSWTAVEGATLYTVKVGAKEFETDKTSIDLSEIDVTLTSGAAYVISVKASAGDKSSVYSDEITSNYNVFVGNLVYANGVVSWAPVIGDGTYTVSVNGEVIADGLTNVSSYALTFKAAGNYTVSVSYCTETNTETFDLNVSIFRITFDSRLGSGVAPIYVAAGDILNLPTTSVRSGYTFSGWYNAPSASNGNGKKYDDAFYGEKDSIILYADWTANEYKITQKVDEGTTGATDGDIVYATYNQNFVLPIVKSDAGAFVGWFTGAGGTGIQLTNSRGESIGTYANIRDIDAYPYFAIGVLEFRENKDGTYAVTGGMNVDQVVDLVIPDTYKGKPVTMILENAFVDAEYSLETISIPNTVTLIGTGALDICYYLESIEIREVEGGHEAVYSSHEGALIRKDLDVTYLELFPRRKAGVFTVPPTVDTIRHKAFYNASQVTKVIISNEVTKVAEEAFYNCSKLEAIEFEAGGEDALTIDANAFYSVKKLTDITLPARVKNITLETFDACVALANINVEEGGQDYGSVDGMLTDGTQQTILYCPITRAGTLEIPVSVLGIGQGAFAGRTGITSVIIHNKMTEIGKNAFTGCTALKSVVFEGGRNVDLVIDESAFINDAAITSVRFEASADNTADRGAVTIGVSAFEGCKNINDLYFAPTANIEEISAYAFKDCERISALSIPATTSKVGDRAFSGCRAIRTVTLAEGGVAIAFGDFVFSGCAQLTSISLPATVTEFDGSVFEGCKNITTIEVHEDNPALVAEGGILYNKAKTEIMYFPRARALDFSALPSTLTKIGASAFQANENITSLRIPAGITEIGANAFDGCIYLSEVIFETTEAMSIGDYAFSNCPELTSITLPVKLTEIGDYAFYASGLGKPATEGDAYETVIIPDTVTTIGDYAFAYTMLGSINIPASVETVGEGAFYKCKNLATLTVTDGDKPLTIGSAEDEYGVFEGTILASVDLSTRTTVIGVKAFNGLTTLKTVTIPEGSKLTTIGVSAFNKTSLTAITLPEGLIGIGVDAFRNISTLEAVTIPTTVTDIGEYAFANMSGLKTFVFAGADTAETPLSINDYAFYNDKALTTITLPKRLERVYDNVTVGTGISITSFYTVFEGCSALENIFVADGCVQFSDIDGVFCINDDQRNPVTVVYCPRGKTGTLSIPSTVTLVHNRAFRGVKLERVEFEEMPNWNGEATLRIGGTMSAEYDDDENAVFGATSNQWGSENTTLKEVVLPAHLAAVGSYAFLNIEPVGANFTLTFNREAGPVEFGEYAITDNYGLKALYLPKVASVHENSFTGNSMLKTVDFALGSTVEKISYWSFTNSSVEKLLNIPASVKIIDDQAFSTSPLKEVTWEEGSQLHTLGTSAFSNAQFKSFTFPESLEFIGSGAFNPRTLEEVILNNVVKSTVALNGGSIFTSYQQANIKSIVVPEGNPYLTVVDGALYSSDMSILMYVPPMMDMGGKTAFDMDDRVTVIEASAFSYYPYDVILHEGLLKIGENAFRAASAITDVVLPASVIHLADYAFYQLPNLVSFKVAENSNLSILGYGAFYYNEKLATVELPDTVSEMDYSAFYNCKALVNVDLPSSLTQIPRFTFQNCTSLKNVTIHDNVSVIGAGAFSGCSALETITIPASVVEFEDYANFGVFETCSKLKNVIFAEGGKLTNIPGETFSGCKVIEDIVLPDTIISVAGNAFKDCNALRSIVIGGSFTDLPAEIFKGKAKLETVVLPDSVESIGNSAFEGCASLKNFTLPAELETIGEAAFRGCAALPSATIGEKVESIGDFAFDGCSSLASLVFAENCQLKALGSDPEVESAIFRGTTALTSVVLADSITTLGASTFQDSGLASVDFPSNLSAIGNRAFSGCVNLTKVEIPSTVKTIGNFAFEDCANITEAKLYLGVEYIGTGVFANCTSLVSANIPASVMRIGGNPFINCSSLTDFRFEEGNEDYILEDGALMDKGKFTIIYYLPTNVIEGGVFEIPSSVGVIAEAAFCDSQLEHIIVPEKVAEIPAMAFMNSKKLKTVKLTNSIISVGAEAFKGCSSLLEITIHEMTSTVGDGAFEGCSSLDKVVFSNRTIALTMGDRVFKDCTSLSDINVPAQLTGLTDYMFANTAITEFVVPESVTSLDVKGVLAGCTKLESVVIHENVTGNLGDEFFMNCAKLENVVLPAGITTIGEVECIGFQQYTGSHYFRKYGTSIYSGAFKGCTSLESIDLSNVSLLGANAFEGCTSLSDIKFATEMYSIGDYAFAGCTSLVEVNMYDNLYGCNGNAPLDVDYSQVDYKPLAIGAFVFADCTSLRTVTLPGTSDESYNYPNYEGIEELKDGAFAGCTSLKLVVIPSMNEFEIGAKPFVGVPSDCVVYFMESYMDAEYIHSTYKDSPDENYNYIDNLGWLTSTDATIIGVDGSVLLKTSTIDTADVKYSVLSTNNGAPSFSDYEIGPDGTVYSKLGGYWDELLPDGMVMIDEAFYFDKDGSIYSDFAGEDNSDDYLVHIKDGHIYYPTPDSVNGGELTFNVNTSRFDVVTFFVITDSSLYTIDENGFVTFDASINAYAYDCVIIKEANAEYVLGTSGSKFFTRVCVDAEGNVTILKAGDPLTLDIIFTADGGVEFPDGTTITADKTVVFKNGAKCEFRDVMVDGVATKDWVLVLEDGSEYTDGLTFVYEDGSVMSLVF